MLDELAILVDQNFFNQVRMIEEHDDPRAKTGPHNVPIFLGPSRKTSPAGRGQIPSDFRKATAAADQAEFGAAQLLTWSV